MSRPPGPGRPPGRVPAPRQSVRVELPCGTCIHQGVCAIEEQIESDLVLTIVGVGRPVRLSLTCSAYQDEADVRIVERSNRSERLRRHWASIPPHERSARTAPARASRRRTTTETRPHR